jgi:Asp-tRNA(Asn)/Glu-tRNA(Gln) amidotransferase B subunit
MIAVTERQTAALEARGLAQRETVDLVFYMRDVETKAAREHEELIDHRIQKEADLAKWQIKNARSQEQREKAQTRLEQAEHAKRIRAMEKAAANEAKTAKQREKVFGTLATAHNALAETMVDAIFAAANKEKVSVAAMVQELLKGVSKNQGIHYYALRLLLGNLKITSKHIFVCSPFYNHYRKDFFVLPLRRS